VTLFFPYFCYPKKCVEKAEEGREKGKRERREKSERKVKINFLVSTIP